MEGYGYFVPLSDAKPPGNQSVIYDHRNYLDFLPKNENAATFLQPVFFLLQVCQVNDNLGKPLDTSCLMPVRYGHYNGDLNSFVAQVS